MHLVAMLEWLRMRKRIADGVCAFFVVNGVRLETQVHGDVCPGHICPGHARENSRIVVFYLTRSAAKRKDYLDLTPGPPPVPPPNFPPQAFLAAQCLVADVVGDRR